MKTIIPFENFSTRCGAGCGPRIVANGHRNLAAGVREEARRVVEAKYAEQWNTSGLVRRWKLQRIMNAEINELVAERMPECSSKTMF